MCELIGIQGTLDSVFNCIDFYQNLSVVGNVSIDDLRKSYIDMYFADYKDRVDRKKKSTYFKNKDNVEYVTHGIILDDVGLKSEDETKNVVPENSYRDVEYQFHGVFLDDVETPKHLDEDVVYVQNGIFLDDNESQSIDVSYVEHGIILEEPDKVISYDSTNVDDGEIEDSDYYEESEYSDEEDFEYSDEEDSEYSNEEDFEYEESDYEENDTKESDYEDFVFEDYNSDEGSVSNSSSELSNITSEEGYTEDLDDSLFSDDLFPDDTEEELFSSAEPLEETGDIQKPIIKSKVVEDKRDTQKPVIQPRVDEGKKDYKNVREFVKYNPGCTVADAKGYFSAKDIQKALLSAKIVEKKNKLYVV